MVIVIQLTLFKTHLSTIACVYLNKHSVMMRIFMFYYFNILK